MCKIQSSLLCLCKEKRTLLYNIYSTRKRVFPKRLSLQQMSYVSESKFICTSCLKDHMTK